MDLFTTARRRLRLALLQANYAPVIKAFPAVRPEFERLAKQRAGPELTWPQFHRHRSDWSKINSKMYQLINRLDKFQQ